MAASTTHPTVEQHFDNRDPAVKATYAAILKAARRFGPVKEEAKKTSIHLVRRTAFAGVATRKNALILTLKSESDLRSTRIAKRERASANRWHLEVRLTEPSAVDEEIVSWLAKAYDLSDAISPKTRTQDDGPGPRKTKSVPFKGRLLEGHKEDAVEVPFDPAERWSIPARALWPGRRGHSVQGTLNGKTFESYVVGRSRRFYVLVTDRLRKSANLSVGDAVEIVLEPRDESTRAGRVVKAGRKSGQKRTKSTKGGMRTGRSS